jgi:hypothetical protein
MWEANTALAEALRRESQEQQAATDVAGGVLNDRQVA